jgi:hypothetical protein
MISIRRLLGVLLAALLIATVLSLPSGAHAAQVRATPAAAKADPVNDFPKMPRRCVDPKLLIPQQPGKCNLNDFKKSRPTIVLWGDSHAWQMIPALRRAAHNRDVNLVAFLMGSCPAMDPALTPKQLEGGVPACLVSNDLALKYVKALKAQKKRVHVLIASYWARYLHVLRTGQGSKYERQMAGFWKKSGPRLFRTLGRLRVPVDVDGPMPAVPLNAKDCFTDEYYAYDCDLSRKQALRNEESAKSWVKRHMQALSGKPRFVNAAKMCNSKTCFATPRGVYTFWDFQHISATMSRKLSFVLDQTVTRAGGSGKPHGGGPILEDDDDGGGGCTIPILCRS